MDKESIGAPDEADGADQEFEREFEHLLVREYRLDRRKRWASMFEFAAYLLILSIFIGRQIILGRLQGYVNAILVVTSPDVILVASLSFIATFAFLLTGTTPLVALATAIKNGDITPRSVGSIIKGVAGHSTNSIFINSFEKLLNARSASTELDVKRSDDPIEKNFSTYLRRSQEAAEVAQRRPNALLFAGTVIAGAGLIFFVLTLPGGKFGFFSLDNGDGGHDIWSSSIQLLPRLLMLVFIQVLAGFFLRQYRSAMEDFRYYESVLRHREAQYLSYALRKPLNDKKAMLEFTRELTSKSEFGVLERGVTTAAIEAQRLERNEFSSLYEQAAAIILKSKANTQSGRKADTRKQS